MPQEIALEIASRQFRVYSRQEIDQISKSVDTVWLLYYADQPYWFSIEMKLGVICIYILLFFILVMVEGSAHDFFFNFSSSFSYKVFFNAVINICTEIGDGVECPITSHASSSRDNSARCVCTNGVNTICISDRSKNVSFFNFVQNNNLPVLLLIAIVVLHYTLTIILIRTPTRA